MLFLAGTAFFLLEMDLRFACPKSRMPPKEIENGFHGVGDLL